MGSGISTKSALKVRCEEDHPRDAVSNYLEALKMLYGEENPDQKEQDVEENRSPDHYVNPLTRRVSVRAWPETSCSVDCETGEIKCNHENEVPNLDCRQPWCLHRSEMVARTRRRLTRLGHAPADGTGAGLWLLRQAMVEGTE